MANEVNQANEKKKSKKSYILSFSLVLILTAATLLFAFYSAGDGNIGAGVISIWNALVDCDVMWLIVIACVVLLSYLFDGLIIFIFCRLYTRHYHYHQGLANAMIGAFYNYVTPGASGGQFMQAYTMKKQGIEISNAASIMVMWFIVYQMALISFDIVAIIFEWDTIMSIRSFQIPNFELFGWDGTIPLLPLIIAGFILNLAVIAGLLLMSYSHHFHNFINRFVIGLLAKIRIIKNPDKTRENLRVQVENFKLELKRLQSNVPTTILIYIINIMILLCRFSIPYFSGLALGAFGSSMGFDISMFFDCTFRGAFHQMVVGLIPLPGGAGVSELFFSALFSDFYIESQAITSSGLIIIRSSSANMMAAQIIWRAATYHIVLITSGLVAALYHAKDKREYIYPTRQTFVDLSSHTYAERKRSVDTLYQTKQISRSSLRKQLAPSKNVEFGLETGDDYTVSYLYSKKPKDGGKSK